MTKENFSAKRTAKCYTREIFELGSVSTLLYNSQKTNIYYNSTNSEKDIYKITHYVIRAGKTELQLVGS